MVFNVYYDTCGTYFWGGPHMLVWAIVRQHCGSFYVVVFQGFGDVSILCQNWGETEKTEKVPKDYQEPRISVLIKTYHMFCLLGTLPRTCCYVSYVYVHVYMYLVQR